MPDPSLDSARRQASQHAPRHELTRAVVVLALAVPLAWLGAGLLLAHLPGGELPQFAAMGAALGYFGHGVYFAHSRARGAVRPRVLVYGAGALAQQVAQALTQACPQAEVVGFVAGPAEAGAAAPAHAVLRCGRPLPELTRELRVDEIVVALAERRGNTSCEQLLACKLDGVRVREAAEVLERLQTWVRLDDVPAVELLFGQAFDQGGLRGAGKRAFDLIFALFLLLLALPVMALTALAIRLESRGPVLYRQQRCGWRGQPFELVKFRSMHCGAESDGQPRWASVEDERATRVGRVIRKLRIDELPQLVNVLRGEMSLVGPRPERPYFVEQLEQQLPLYALRHSVKPGVTGWAQVRHHYGGSLEDARRKLEYDLYYVKRHSLWWDLAILLETVVVVLTARGAR
jgi:sugar transferase (PEP-CTERM system associated)